MGPDERNWPLSAADIDACHHRMQAGVAALVRAPYRVVRTRGKYRYTTFCGALRVRSGPAGTQVVATIRPMHSHRFRGLRPRLRHSEALRGRDLLQELLYRSVPVATKALIYRFETRENASVIPDLVAPRVQELQQILSQRGHDLVGDLEAELSPP